MTAGRRHELDPPRPGEPQDDLASLLRAWIALQREELAYLRRLEALLERLESDAVSPENLQPILGLVPGTELGPRPEHAETETPASDLHPAEGPAALAHEGRDEISSGPGDWRAEAEPALHPDSIPALPWEPLALDYDPTLLLLGEESTWVGIPWIFVSEVRLTEEPVARPGHSSLANLLGMRTSSSIPPTSQEEPARQGPVRAGPVRAEPRREESSSGARSNTPSNKEASPDEEPNLSGASGVLPPELRQEPSREARQEPPQEPYEVAWNVSGREGSLRCNQIGGLARLSGAAAKGMNRLLLPSLEDPDSPPRLLTLAEFLFFQRERRTRRGSSRTAVESPLLTPLRSNVAEGATRSKEAESPQVAAESAAPAGEKPVLGSMERPSKNASDESAGPEELEPRIEEGTEIEKEEPIPSGRQPHSIDWNESPASGEEPRRVDWEELTASDQETVSEMGEEDAVLPKAPEPSFAAPSMPLAPPAPAARRGRSALVAVHYLPARVGLVRALSAGGWEVVEEASLEELPRWLEERSFGAVFYEPLDRSPLGHRAVLEGTETQGTRIFEVGSRLRTPAEMSPPGRFPRIFYPFREGEIEQLLKSH